MKKLTLCEPGSEKPGPRVILDTNVWGYLAQQNAGEKLAELAHDLSLNIQVTPSVLYEALRSPNPSTRSSLAELMTRPCWQRLMPEAFGESIELLGEIRRLRPQWLHHRPLHQRYQMYYNDWTSIDVGFWDRVRKNPDLESDRIIALDDGQLEAARHESEQRRGLMRSATFLEQASLRELVVKWRVPVPGWDGTPVSAWRVAGLTISGYALRAKTHPFRDWLRAFVLFSETQKDHASWNHFWLHEVEEKRMPRFWISWAFEHLMAFRKVTNGTPCDIQLSTYLVGSDLVVSADKGFISSSRRCHSEAPFNIAQARLIPAGRQGVEALLNYLREFSSGRPAV